MGALSMIGQLVGSFPEIAPVWTPTPYEDVNKGRPLVKDAIEITLAEYNLDTKDMITAHHLKDYRQRTFRLALLPKCDILFDEILEGSDYWRELLHTQIHFN